MRKNQKRSADKVNNHHDELLRIFDFPMFVCISRHRNGVVAACLAEYLQDLSMICPTL